MVQEQLIKECQAGNRKAQRELYDRYASALYGCCLKYAPNAQEAQDVLQDSFITIFDKIKQFKSKGSLEGWCKRIAINTALQRYRGKKVYQLENEGAIPETGVEVEEPEDISLQDMLQMIQQLPERYRMVFSLYTLDGYGHKEIASMMGITEGTSKSNLSRAKQNLQEMILQWRENNASDVS
ncbi:RNA polymerase sigma factor [Nonlabens ponticola]|uniref:Sigma-70 family RNA polymerase sigma factor n=1 Tax=Nonlabens ponticola TaxID=2496866 RepID=A0A3S9MVL4_9FLAO|nr:sigma-70 family RNA polymerase sigma factor [Nonlabens ponticola]AZQ43220.1 sigma-70 family RNA polymerase sigma factor [Nonlabens ponticola]